MDTKFLEELGGTLLEDIWSGTLSGTTGTQSQNSKFYLSFRIIFDDAYNG